MQAVSAARSDVRLVPSSLEALRGLVAGDLGAAARASGLAFGTRVWPDDADMREGLSVHLAACERNAGDLMWRVYLIALEGQARGQARGLAPSLAPPIDTAVGHAGFKGGPTRSGELEIYWCVEPRWRGRGIATASAASLCEFAFRQPRVSAITATIARANVPSQHVASALGMRELDEVRYGMPLWRVTRGEWRPPAIADRAPLPAIVAN